MSNALEGRTYIDYRWDVREGAQLHFDVNRMQRVYSKQDITEVQTHHVVPNDKWVMERPSGWAQRVGAIYGVYEELFYTDKHGAKRALIICDRPFGYVTADEEDIDRSVFPSTVKPNGRKRLICAQQIHKGELGWSVPTPPLYYVRQPFEEGQKPSIVKAHQRRRGYGWMLLRELGEVGFADSYDPDSWVKLVLGYWQFSGHLHYDESGRRVGTLVDTFWGSAHDIKAGKVEVVSMTPEQFREEASYDSTQLWIRRGFALTILRLQCLGVKPSVLQHT